MHSPKHSLFLNLRVKIRAMAAMWAPESPSQMLVHRCQLLPPGRKHERKCAPKPDEYPPAWQDSEGGSSVQLRTAMMPAEVRISSLPSLPGGVLWITCCKSQDLKSSQLNHSSWEVSARRTCIFLAADQQMAASSARHLAEDYRPGLLAANRAQPTRHRTVNKVMGWTNGKRHMNWKEHAAVGHSLFSCPCPSLLCAPGRACCTPAYANVEFLVARSGNLFEALGGEGKHSKPFTP